MKKSELSFKLAALTEHRRKLIFDALKRANIEYVQHEKPFIYCGNGIISAGSCPEEFEENDRLPEVTLEQAIELIKGA